MLPTASSTNRNYITPAGIQRRLQQIQTQNKRLKAGGTVCLVLSVVAFITGATLMVLDFDGNDDEYYIEDGDIKTRMQVIS
nr:hypothetical protein HmN_000474700 [Hymenolepis microstoma]